MIYETFFTLAQAAAQSPAPTGGAAGMGGFLVPMLCIIAVIYFMSIRPQNQKQKQHLALISSIKTGDKVITSGGMHGLVANVKDTTVLVKVADNVKIEVDKTAIAVVTKRSEDDPAPAS